MADLPEDAKTETPKATENSPAPQAAEPHEDPSLLAQTHFHPEKVQWDWKGGCFSPKTYRAQKLMAVILFVLCVAGAFWVYSPCGRESVWHWIIWLIVPTAMFLWFWIKGLILSKTITYTLVDDNLVCKKGLLFQKTETLLIPQMSDVRMTQSLLDRLINHVGTVTIYVAGEPGKSADGTQISGRGESTFVMRGIEKPRVAFESLEKMRAAYAAKRGLVGFDGDAGDDIVDGGAA
ncbi:MAG: PH domain-containing protein [Thermoguttaceae bacterium]|nr:PH domain-containing protein [Thermoguttaceae bacterium]MBQ3333048.1 PH domain-containing protein [Thermoguttaceae bacterium]MBQ6619880.1 PH domain-containing protein [Thermoguttaceae bacterium]